MKKCGFLLLLPLVYSFTHYLSFPSMCLKSGLGIGGKNDEGRAVNEKKGKQHVV